MFFCWGRKEKNVEEPKAAKKLEQQQKRATIASTFDVPSPQPPIPKPIEPKPKQELKAPIPAFPVKKLMSSPPEQQHREPEIALLQNNCELLLFNSSEDKELFLSFIVKKTYVTSSGREFRGGVPFVDEQLYDVVAKRNREGLTLVVVEHKDEYMQRKFHKQQEAYILFMVLPQQMHYVSKLTSRSRVGLQSSISEEEEIRKDSKRGRLPTATSTLSSSLYSPSKQEKQSIPLQSISFSTINQVRLAFFDQIVVWAPMCRDSSLPSSIKRWLEGVINGIQTIPNLEKTTIVLPRETELNDLLIILHDLIHEKIKNQSLECACNMIHFELEAIYIDNNLQRVIIKKRFEEGDLTIMLMALSLFLLEFNDRSKTFYLQLIEKLRNVTIKEYMAIKSALKNGNYSKRTVLKALRDNKLLHQEEITKLAELYNDLPKLADPWEYEQQYRFVVLRELRARLSQFLSGRNEIPRNSSCMVINVDAGPIDEPSNTSKQQEVLVPSPKDDLQKQRGEDFKLSLHQLQLQIEISQDPSPQDSHLIHKKLTEDDYELMSPRKVSRRKHSNQY